MKNTAVGTERYNNVKRLLLSFGPVKSNRSRLIPFVITSMTRISSPPKPLSLWKWLIWQSSSNDEAFFSWTYQFSNLFQTFKNWTVFFFCRWKQFNADEIPKLSLYIWSFHWQLVIYKLFHDTLRRKKTANSKKSNKMSCIQYTVSLNIAYIKLWRKHTRTVSMKEETMKGVIAAAVHLKNKTYFIS